MSNGQFAGLLGRLLIDGPRYTEEKDRSFWDTWLTWPVRLLIVAGAWAVGAIWGDTPGGIQLGWGLQYGLFIAVAIVVSFWSIILVLNASLAGLWVLLSRTRLAPRIDAREHVSWDLLDVVTWLNRQVSHIEVFSTYLAIAIVLRPRLDYQLPLAAGVLLLGGPIVDAVTQRFGSPETRRSRAALLMARRLLIYLLTAAGLLLLAFWPGAQFWTFFPLLLSSAPALVLRLWRFAARRKQVRDPELLSRAGRGSESAAPPGRAGQDMRLQRAELQNKGTPWFAPALVLGVTVLIVALSLWQKGRLAQRASDALDGPSPPEDTCARETGGPERAAISMFILADSQLHELGGARFPGQMEVADTLVEVARRPVELDMLSTAAVVHFRRVFDRFSKKAGGAGGFWAHLGDFADLSCTREMDRMLGLLGHFDDGKARALAGVAPGNHDSSFTGNFAWSPYWTPACENAEPPDTRETKSPKPVYGRLDKVGSDARLALFVEGHHAEGASSEIVKGGILDALWPASPAVVGEVTARYAVAPIGLLGSGGKQRGVVAVFIDTADQLARDYGVAGQFGTFSTKQAGAILKEVGKVKQTPGYADPWYVVFGHDPYMELTPGSRRALDGLIHGLDVGSSKCSSSEELCKGPRVLALITAHTHHAEAHRHCINGRVLREIVVGSVIDPPQQAAKLEIGEDARGNASVRVSTLPVVSRDGFTCEPPPAVPDGAVTADGGTVDGVPEGGVPGDSVTAGRCHGVVATLAAAKECQDLVDGPSSGQGQDLSCEELERPLSLDEEVSGLVQHGGPREPDEIMKVEMKRARVLLRCLCRDVPHTGEPAIEACADQGPPLYGERYAAVIEALANDPVRADEVTCLGWAASAVQQHKANGMTMADALRCAFDDPTLPAARVVVATSEDETCP